MKQARRKELKTNELSAYLRQIYEAAARNVNYLIGGVVIAVLVLVIGLVIQHNRHAALQAAWTNYYELREQSVATKPELIDRTRNLSSECADYPNLEPLVLELLAGQTYDMALTLTESKDQDRRLELLNEAKGVYLELLQKFDDQANVVSRARMGLAAAEETLFVAGKGDLEQVREQYRKLIATENSVFKPLAQKLLDDLDTRMAKLEIVASRPAEAPAKTATIEIGEPVINKKDAKLQVQTRPTTAPAATAPAP